jgi:3-hydroxyisobutyrate dehydrogenase-like beta-hydroxyacid dehydrogenase
MNWPGGLTVYDVNGRGYAALTQDGIRVAATLSELFDAHIVSIVDIASSGVQDIVDDLGRHLRPGAIIAVHSTIDESSVTEAAKDLLRWGVHLVDAPVSGGPTAALMGELAVMIGATPEVFSALEAPFGQWASLVVHAGATGMGLRMKLAESLVQFATITAAQEAQHLVVCL